MTRPTATLDPRCVTAGDYLAWTTWVGNITVQYVQTVRRRYGTWFLLMAVDGHAEGHDRLPRHARRATTLEATAFDAVRDRGGRPAAPPAIAAHPSGRAAGEIPDAPNVEGHRDRECGQHRPAGPTRAWCSACVEWCYRDGPCVGCERGRQVLLDPSGDVRRLAEAINGTATDADVSEASEVLHRLAVESAAQCESS